MQYGFFKTNLTTNRKSVIACCLSLCYVDFGDIMLKEIDCVKLISIYESPASRHAYTKSRITHGIVYKLSGQSAYQFDTVPSEEIIMSQGDVLFIPQGASFTLEQTSPGESRYIVINFTANIPDAQPRLLGQIDGADQLFIKLANFWLFGEYCKRYECYSLFYRLLADITAKDMQDYKTSYQKSLIASSMDYLESRIFSCDLKISDIIEISDISEPYFRKIFHAVYGVTPKQYIQNKRLARARDILNGDDCTSIQAVALSVGYDDALYFSRVFRAKYGQSPTEYLRSARHK